MAQRMGVLVFLHLYQRNIIAMQMAEEQLPAAFYVQGDSGWDFVTWAAFQCNRIWFQDFIELWARALPSCQSHLMCFSFFSYSDAWFCSVGAGVCGSAGGDHHKAQTGGDDLVLIKAFPWGLPCGGREESGGPSMMNVSGKWTGHNHNGPSPYCSPYWGNGWVAPDNTQKNTLMHSYRQIHAHVI